ncbi:hypothetical protein PIB30_012432 [Stylosanthes scabra]|uniref:Peptidase A1 domain-containing protein n=1 Tax=Stylosanthes scabra TaxID=79078 RepID=A0ABU6S6C9_9FABA|nr:hypothetical protein [Stylosanthes scabra]
MRINGKQVPINSSLLTINKENGLGGTRISSDFPYGVLESSIYKAFTKLFVKEASSSRFNLTTISTFVKPYGVCYSAERVTVTNGSPVVPTIDLVLHRDDVVWRLGGANSMVRVTNKKKKLDVWCLGFVNGGTPNKTSIVIGGKQLEENLVQFDLDNNRFGFTSSLASRSLSCADFKDYNTKAGRAFDETGQTGLFDTATLNIQNALIIINKAKYMKLWMMK